MEYASKGLAGTALGFGIGGAALGLANGGLGNLLGGLNQNKRSEAADIAAAVTPAMTVAAMLAARQQEPTCSENMPVTRYDLEREQKLAAKDSEIALLKANTYNDGKMLEVYGYIDGQLKDVREALCKQAVHNQRTEDSFALVKQDVESVRKEALDAVKTTPSSPTSTRPFIPSRSPTSPRAPRPRRRRSTIRSRSAAAATSKHRGRQSPPQSLKEGSCDDSDDRSGHARRDALRRQ